MILWDEWNKFAVDNIGEMSLDTKPKLSFEYDELRYVKGGEIWLTKDGTTTPLLTSQIAEIDTYIAKLRSKYVPMVIGVDANGKCLGTVRQDDERIAQVATYSPMNDDYRWIDGDWKLVHTVNDNGIEDPNGQHIITEPKYSRLATWCFDTNTWIITDDVNESKDKAVKSVLSWLVSNIHDSVDNKDQIANLLMGASLKVAKKKLDSEKYETIKLIIESTMTEIQTLCESVEDYDIVADNLNRTRL